MRYVYWAIGILASLLTGAVVAFTLGTWLAVLASLLLLGLAVYAAQSPDERRPVPRIALAVLLVVSGGLLIYGAVTVGGAFSDTSGPVEPADAEALKRAEAKLDEDVGDKAGFRLQLTSEELTALVQNELQRAQAPFRRVDFDIVAGSSGHIAFAAVFRNGELDMRGRLAVGTDAGRLRVQLEDVDLGVLNLPGLAEGAVEDLINPFANQALAAGGAEIQAIDFSPGMLTIIGTQSDGRILSSADLIAAFPRQAAARQGPEMRIGRGLVNARRAEGSPWYVALGDSLAANVGAPEPRDGYVSRFHKFLQESDGTDYGLQNFGAAGETSGSFIRNGQLEEAQRFLRSHEVAYVTLNIGANDLLGHLASSDCSRAVTSPDCQSRIEKSRAAYRENLNRILAGLRDAAPDAEIIFLTPYNPFSLGFESRVAFEAQSNRVVEAFNELAANVAEEHGVVVADGFTPMKGTTSVTTHILSNPPDIHPKAAGYDVLAAALAATVRDGQGRD